MHTLSTHLHTHMYTRTCMWMYTHYTCTNGQTTYELAYKHACKGQTHTETHNTEKQTDTGGGGIDILHLSVQSMQSCWESGVCSPQDEISTL